MAVRQVVVHGRKVWQARVAVGDLRRSRVCASKVEAKEAEAALIHDLKGQAARAEQEGRGPATIRGLFEFYVDDLEKRSKSPDTVYRASQTARVVEAVLPGLLATPVSAVTKADIYAFRKARERTGTKPSTINRDLRTIRAMLKQIRPEFKFPGDAFTREDNTRVRFLRPEEELLTLDVIQEPFQSMSKLSALGLMRQGDVRTLRKDMVHLSQGVLLLPKTKTGPRSVVLSEAAQAILRERLKDYPDSPWVFPNPATGRPYSRVHVSRVWRKVARGAGLRDFTFHDLKHHGATMAINSPNVSTAILQAFGGWRSEAMVKRYASVTDASLRAAAEAAAGNGNAKWQQPRKAALARAK
jgi:integrase